MTAQRCPPKLLFHETFHQQTRTALRHSIQEKVQDTALALPRQRRKRSSSPSEEITSRTLCGQNQQKRVLVPSRTGNIHRARVRGVTPAPQKKEARTPEAPNIVQLASGANQQYTSCRTAKRWTPLSTHRLVPTSHSPRRKRLT